MHLHLVVPGLLWPAATLSEAVRDLSLPAFSALLGRAARRLAPPQGLADWLAAAFSLGGDEIPWGALRRLGEADGERARGGAWLCADPTHLRFARDTLVLTDARHLNIGAEESAAWIDALNTHFADLGQFEAATPQRWYLRLKATPLIRTQPLERVVGRSFDLFLPEGAQARPWRAVLNEAQMLLHAHPANAAREARGEASVNGLWLWGAGSLPQSLPAPYAAVLADDPIVIGLARAAGLDCRPLPPRAPEAAAAAKVSRRGTAAQGGEAPQLAVVDSLQGAAADRDLSEWRAGLVRLEQDWLAPLLGALYAGQLRALRLSAPGDEASLELEITAAERWKFWRRPVHPGALAAEISAANPAS